MNEWNELDEELMLALEASLAGSGVKPRWVFSHIIATVRKYAAQPSAQRTCDHARTLRMPSGKLFCVVCQEYIA